MEKEMIGKISREIEGCIKANQKFLIIHHNDNDGRFACQIMNDLIVLLHKEYYGSSSTPTVKTEEYNYSDRIPNWPELEKEYAGYTLIVVDYMIYKKKEMKDPKWAGVIWIDHHKSASTSINNDEVATDAMHYIVTRQFCATELCYQIATFLCPEYWSMKKDLLIYLIGCYDINRTPDDQKIMFMLKPEQRVSAHRYLNSYTRKAAIDGMAHPLIKKLLNDEKAIDMALEMGEDFYENDLEANELLFKAFAKKVKWEGHTIYVRYGYGNGYSYGYHCQEVDFVILYSKNIRSGEYVYGLYQGSADVDLSEIAIKYGGGGHKNAAGFRSKEDIFRDMPIIK